MKTSATDELAASNDAFVNRKDAAAASNDARQYDNYYNSFDGPSFQRFGGFGPFY